MHLEVGQQHEGGMSMCYFYLSDCIYGHWLTSYILLLFFLQPSLHILTMNVTADIADRC